MRLCALDELTDPGARGFSMPTSAEGLFQGFVVRQGTTVRGYVDRCPHAGLPLTQTADAYLTLDGQFIGCAWHGAVFRIADGACLGGPCAGRRLTPWLVRRDATGDLHAEIPPG